MPTSNALGNMAAQRNLLRKADDLGSLHKTTLITEQIEGRQLKGGKIDAVNPPEFTGTIIPVSLAIVAVTLLIFRLLHKREQSLTNDFIVNLDRVPCMNCYFFV